jgi:hypothetical protein
MEDVPDKDWPMIFRAPPVLGSSFAALSAAALLVSACSTDDGEVGPKDGPGGGGGGSASVAGAGGTGTSTGGAGGSSAGLGGSNGAGTTSMGGVSSNGGSSGAGSSAGGTATAGGAAACIVCDDFESSATGPDPAKWTIDSTRMVGTATVDSMGAYGSAKSLKVSGGYLKIDTKAGLFTGVASKFWVRINMRFDIAQPADHVTYLMLTDAAKTGELRVGAQNQGMIWNYSTNDTILPDYNEAANSLKPTANEWHCFEFHFDSDTPALHVYMDGQESTQMLLDATATPGIDDRWLRDMPGWKPQITSFAFGSGDPTAGKVTTWYDDIAIANDRPGCTF